MYVYMSECFYVFMYLYVCNPMRERERERERERDREGGGNKFLEGNLIGLKNVAICLHDPIILYLAHGF